MKEFFGEDKVLNVATFSKISSKTAIEKACKGLNISDDKANYYKSLIPVNRGKVTDLKTAIYGNKEQGISPVSGLKKEMSEYPYLIEAAIGLEGLITNRGTHAAGIIVCNEPYTNYIAAMRSADGTLETCYDLWDSEEAGCIKFDMLTTVCADKIHKTMDYLLEAGKITWAGSLKATYYKWLHPDVIEYNNKDMWNILPTIYSIFQFDTPVSQKALNATHPYSVMDLSAANSLLRLMPDNADEPPMDRYTRYKENHNAWVKDTIDFGLNDEERDILWEYLGDAYGLADSQEKIMRISMDKRVSGYTLKEANKLRKSIAKKDEKLQEEAKALFFDMGSKQGTRDVFLDYIWNVVFAASMGYSFSQLHSYSYSIIALQELNLNYFYNKVYWNCACLTIEASGLSDDGEKKGSTDYGEVAKAIYKMKQSNIEVSSPSINQSELTFAPMEENNTIFYGLAGISGINPDIANQIINNRPYSSLINFIEKNTYNGSLVTPSKYITLIKSGCFDEFCNDRIKTMKQYVAHTTPKATQLTMANMPNIKATMKLDKNIFGAYNFYKYVTEKERLYGNHPKFKSKKLYWLDDKALRYFNANCRTSMVEGTGYWEEDGMTIVVDKELEKLLKPSIDNIKSYINTPEFLAEYNKAQMRKKFNEIDENPDPNRWSFETLAYYSKEHELTSVNLAKYNISKFNELPETPVFIEKAFKGRTWRQYELASICGTIIDKDDSNHYFMLLTPDNNVVGVKMNQGSFAHYKARISDDNGIIDDSWIKRGSLVIVSGYRYGNDFSCKKYKNSIYQHQMEKITKVYSNGDIDIQLTRYNSEEE